MASKYDIETGIEMFGGGLSGIGMGSKLAGTFLGPTLGWSLGAGVGLGSMALSLAGRHARRKAYKANKKAINRAHALNVANMKRIHGMQAQAIRGGTKGIGGGHAVGAGREGTIQKAARTQQAEIAGLERESELARYKAAKRQNRAAQGRGGSASALESLLGVGQTILGMIEPAPKYTGGPYTGSWKETAHPYSQTAWETPVL